MSSSSPSQTTKLTNCRLAIDGKLVARDLYVSAATGRILDPQAAFFSGHAQPADVRDLGGRIVSPGWLEVQVNGGWGFDFSVPSDRYEEDLAMFGREVVKTGVTSYVPTLTSQKAEVYLRTVPYLVQKDTRRAEDGAESLGAHLEGPFINPEKNGIHKKEVLQKPTSFDKLQACYGSENLNIDPATGRSRTKYVTLAPELDPSETVIRELKARGIIVSAGHSTASLPQMQRAIELGATMITHLYNAMNQPHHREAGIVGILGEQEKSRARVQPGFQRPYYGIIADDIHVHPSMVRVAYGAHPNGCILVTDAMMLLGMPDGEYDWTNGERIIKKGALLTLKEIPIAEALKSVTSNPAKMLGVEKTKGTLEVGADADLVILSDSVSGDGNTSITIDEVWKFGKQVYQNSKSKNNELRSRL